MWRSTPSTNMAATVRITDEPLHKKVLKENRRGEFHEECDAENADGHRLGGAAGGGGKRAAAPELDCPSPGTDAGRHDGALVRGGPLLAQALAQSLGAGHDHRSFDGRP